jgi:hypothetical protein
LRRKTALSVKKGFWRSLYRTLRAFLFLKECIDMGIEYKRVSKLEMLKKVIDRITKGQLVQDKFDFKIIKRFEESDGTLKFRVQYSTGNIVLIDPVQTQEEYEEAIWECIKNIRRYERRWRIYSGLVKKVKQNKLKESDAKRIALNQIGKVENRNLDAVEKDNWNESLEKLAQQYSQLLEISNRDYRFLTVKLKSFRKEIAKTDVKEKTDIPVYLIDQDNYIDKFKNACVKRNLVKGKTIPVDILYDIAVEIGMKNMLPKKKFKDGNANYAKARVYAAETNYKKKRRKT